MTHAALRLRLAHIITNQSEAARRSGIDQGNISRWLAGNDAALSMESLRRVCLACGWELGYDLRRRPRKSATESS